MLGVAMGNLLLLCAVVSPVLFSALGLFLWRYVVDRDDRRSPINLALHHQAGEQLRRAVEKANDTFSESMTLVAILGPLFMLAWLLVRMEHFDWTQLQLGLGDGLLAMFALVMWGGLTWRTIAAGRRLRRLRRGLRAELATAQCLTPLIAEGCYVLHDVPGDGFNIDHVVIGPQVVFAVESKSRMKPAKGGKDSARVQYDGKLLRFPEHAETKPLDQAKAQARWLQRELSGAVGEDIKVVPVLSLPGWFVDGRGNRDDVVVCNPLNPAFMLRPAFGEAMEPALRKRLLHALSKRYPRQD